MTDYPKPTSQVEAATLVEQLLSQWASGQPKKVELLKYIIGASTTDKVWKFKQAASEVEGEAGDGYSNAIVVLYGDGNNGKSAYLGLLRNAVETVGLKDRCHCVINSLLTHGDDVIDITGKTAIFSDIEHNSTIKHCPNNARLLLQSNFHPNATPGIKLMYVDFNSHFVSDEVDVDNHRYPANFDLNAILASPYIKQYLGQLAKTYAAKFLALEDFASLF